MRRSFISLIELSLALISFASLALPCSWKIFSESFR